MILKTCDDDWIDNYCKNKVSWFSSKVDNIQRTSACRNSFYYYSPLLEISLDDWYFLKKIKKYLFK